MDYELTKQAWNYMVAYAQKYGLRLEPQNVKGQPVYDEQDQLWAVFLSHLAHLEREAKREG